MLHTLMRIHPLFPAILSITFLVLLIALLLHIVQLYAFLSLDQTRFPSITTLRPHFGWLVNFLVLLLCLMGYLILRHPDSYLNWHFIGFSILTIPTLFGLAIYTCLQKKIQINPKKITTGLFILENILLIGFALKEII